MFTGVQNEKWGFLRPLSILVCLPLVQVAAERSYFDQKYGNHFERTYGWVWLLKLQEELEKNAQMTSITPVPVPVPKLSLSRQYLGCHSPPPLFPYRGAAQHIPT